MMWKFCCLGHQYIYEMWKHLILFSVIHYIAGLVWGQFLLVLEGRLWHSSSYQFLDFYNRLHHLCFKTFTNPLIMCLFLARWNLVMFVVWMLVSGYGWQLQHSPVIVWHFDFPLSQIDILYCWENSSLLSDIVSFVMVGCWLVSNFRCCLEFVILTTLCHYTYSLTFKYYLGIDISSQILVRSQISYF